MISAIVKFFQKLYSGEETNTNHDHDESICLLFYESDEEHLLNCIRSIFSYAGIEIQEKEISKEEFTNLPNKKTSTINFAIKVDDVHFFDGFETILRFAGKVSKTYPTKNRLDASEVDSFLELFSQFVKPIFNQFPIKLSENELLEHKKWCVEEHIPLYMKILNNELERIVGENKDMVEEVYLGKFDSPTIADFCWVYTIERLQQMEELKFDLNSYENLKKLCYDFERLGLYPYTAEEKCSELLKEVVGNEEHISQYESSTEECKKSL